MFCARCKQRYPDDAAYCAVCGERLVDAGPSDNNPAVTTRDPREASATAGSAPTHRPRTSLRNACIALVVLLPVAALAVGLLRSSSGPSRTASPAPALSEGCGTPAASGLDVDRTAITGIYFVGFKSDESEVVEGENEIALEITNAGELKAVLNDREELIEAVAAEVEERNDGACGVHLSFIGKGYAVKLRGDLCGEQFTGRFEGSQGATAVVTGSFEGHKVSDDPNAWTTPEDWEAEEEGARGSWHPVPVLIGKSMGEVVDELGEPHQTRQRWRNAIDWFYRPQGPEASTDVLLVQVDPDTRDVWEVEYFPPQGVPVGTVIAKALPKEPSTKCVLVSKSDRIWLFWKLNGIARRGVTTGTVEIHAEFAEAYRIAEEFDLEDGIKHNIYRATEELVGQWRTASVVAYRQVRTNDCRPKSRYVDGPVPGFKPLSTDAGWCMVDR
jgi:hypothetical protein